MRPMDCATRLAVIPGIILALSLCYGSTPAAEKDSAKVNMQDLFKLSAYVKAAFQEVEKVRADSSAHLEKLASEISDMEQQLEKAKDSLRSDERAKLEASLRMKKEDLKSESEAARAKFQLKRRSEENLVNMKIKEIVARIAKEEGLKMVLPEHLFLYSVGVLDITSKVLKALDAGIPEKREEQKQPIPRPETQKP